MNPFLHFWSPFPLGRLQSLALTQVLLQYVFLTENADQASTIQRFNEIKGFLADVLVNLPASSVEIEKQHTNVQLDAQIHRSQAAKPVALQMDSYIGMCQLEHAERKEAIERYVMGSSQGKVRRLLVARQIDSSAPAFRVTKKSDVSRRGQKKSKRKGLLPYALSLDD